MIKDQIIKGNLNDFCIEFNYNSLSEESAFEYFTNYLILSRINSQIFEDNDYLENVCVDEGKNFGIDGIALLINNSLILTKDNIDFFKKTAEFYPSLNMNMVFTQTKTSSSLDTGDLLKFIASVKSFLKSESVSKAKNQLEKLIDIKNEMISYETQKCVDRYSGPSLNLYFITTSAEAKDHFVTNLIEEQRTDLQKSFSLFKTVNISLVGRDSIIKYNQEIQNKVECRIVFKDKVDLGGINGVGKAFLGHLPATEYLKLIVDDEGNLRRNLFYENVRDFKGEQNKVNREIGDTIKSDIFQDKFVLMNNGVTIVTKMIDTNYQGGEMKVVNYQIVNGCQTSNVLYLNRSLITNSKILIPLKLIECQDNDITNEITKATNNQNPVPEEAFIALEHFPKSLQLFFDNVSKTAPTRLYYERRSREYDYIQPTINQAQIFHLHKLIRAIVATFLEQPHSCHRFPGELYKKITGNLFGKEKKMFTKDQSPYPYYASCYIWYAVEKRFNERKFNKIYKPFKFHLQMLVKLLIERKNPYSFENLRETEKLCKPMMETVWNDDKFNEIASKAYIILDRVFNSVPHENIENLSRDPAFTRLLIKEV